MFIIHLFVAFSYTCAVIRTLTWIRVLFVVVGSIDIKYGFAAITLLVLIANFSPSDCGHNNSFDAHANETNLRPYNFHRLHRAFAVLFYSDLACSIYLHLLTRILLLTLINSFRV